MSDQRLRELERRWRETRAVADEAAWLVERVRSGDLSRERLELAAYCGHPAALRAGAPAGPTYPSDLIGGLEAWSAVLAAWAMVEAYDGQSALLVRIRERLHDAFDDGVDVVLALRDTLPSHERLAAFEKTATLAVHAVARDPRRGDPADPDVLRALALIRPRYPYLDPGEWSYDRCERARGGRGWDHHFVYTRARTSSGPSPGSVPASSGWEPPPDAPRVVIDLVARLVPDDLPMPPAFVREAAIGRALA